MAIEIGDVVQLNPHTVRNPAMGACFMTVTAVAEAYVEGYVQVMGERFDQASRMAFYRASLSEIEGPIGRAAWVAA